VLCSLFVLSASLTFTREKSNVAKTNKEPRTKNQEQKTAKLVLLINAQPDYIRLFSPDRLLCNSGAFCRIAVRPHSRVTVSSRPAAAVHLHCRSNPQPA